MVFTPYIIIIIIIVVVVVVVILYLIHMQGLFDDLLSIVKFYFKTKGSSILFF